MSKVTNFIVQNYTLQGTRNTVLCSEHYKTIKVLDELRKSGNICSTDHYFLYSPNEKKKMGTFYYF